MLECPMTDGVPRPESSGKNLKSKELGLRRLEDGVGGLLVLLGGQGALFEIQRLFEQ